MRSRLMVWLLPSLVLLVVAIALVLAAFSDIAFMHRTFSTSLVMYGTNGGLPVTGATVQVPADDFRVDRGASAWQFEPWAQVVHNLAAKGELPLWDPYQGMGAPLAANMQSAVFDPLMLPIHLHPSLKVWDLSILLWFVAAIWLTQLYLRSLGLGLAATIAGAAVFALSGFFMIYSNNQFVRAYFYIPVALLLIDKVVRSSRLRWVGLLGAVVAGELYVGMPESSLAVLTLAGCYAIFRLATVAEAGQRLRGSLRLLGAGGLGLCLAAPLLLLFFQYASAATTTHSPGGPAGLTADDVRLLLLWLVPFANNPGNLGFPGAYSGVRDWVGAAAVMLVLFGLCSGREWRRRPSILFAAFGLILMLKMYGFGPIQWLGTIPIGSQAVFPVYFMPAAAFCLAVLAASGVQAIADCSWNRRVFLAVVVVASLGVAWLIGDNAAVRAAYGIPLTIYFGIALAFAAAVVVAAIGLPRRTAPWLATAAVVTELLLLVPHGIYLPRVNPYVRPPWLKAAGNDASGAADRFFGFDAKLFPDISGVYGVQDIRALDALYPNRYVKYITTFIQPDFGSRFEGGPFSQHEGAKPPDIAGNPMVDLLGVRYLVAGTSASDDPFLTTAGTGEAKSLRLVASAGGADVYENQASLPRAFVAHNLTYVSDMGAAVRTLSDTEPRFSDGAIRVTRFNPRTDAIVEASPPPTPARPCAGGSDSARITGYSSQQVAIEVNSTCPGLLVLSDMYYPGWDATVNGSAATIRATDIALRGVAIKGGHSVVTFRYRPANFGYGLLVALGSLLALAAVAGWRRVRPRGRAVDAPLSGPRP